MKSNETQTVKLVGILQYEVKLELHIFPLS